MKVNGIWRNTFDSRLARSWSYFFYIFFFVASKGGEYWLVSTEHGSELAKHFDISSGMGKSNDISGKEILSFVWQHISPNTFCQNGLPLLQSNSDHPSGVREDSECRKALKIQCDTSILPNANVFDVAWCRSKDMLNMWHISQSHNEHSTGVALKSAFGTERPQLFRQFSFNTWAGEIHSKISLFSTEEKPKIYCHLLCTIVSFANVIGSQNTFDHKSCVSSE